MPAVFPHAGSIYGDGDGGIVAEIREKQEGLHQRPGEKFG